MQYGSCFDINLFSCKLVTRSELKCYNYNIGQTFGEPSILDTKDLPIKKGSLQSILPLLDYYNDKGA